MHLSLAALQKTPKWPHISEETYILHVACALGGIAWSLRSCVLAIATVHSCCVLSRSLLHCKIRYSLAGQDTRLSPERPGFESRWRNYLPTCCWGACGAEAADSQICMRPACGWCPLVHLAGWPSWRTPLPTQTVSLAMARPFSLLATAAEEHHCCPHRVPA